MTAPWPRSSWAPDAATEDPLGDFERDDLLVFVPAIMSVGLIFSITTLLRDAFHRTGARARERRTLVETNATLEYLLGAQEPPTFAFGVLRRSTYLATAATLALGSIALAIVAGFGYLQDEGPVRHLGIVLALAAVASCSALVIAFAAISIWRSWPDLPAWTVTVARYVPLTFDPDRRGGGPSWVLTAGLVTAAFGTVLLTALVATSATLTREIDEPLSRWFASLDYVGGVHAIDLIGGTVISMGFVGLIGLSGFRCRVMALMFPVAFMVSWVTTSVLHEVFKRPRPLGLGDWESYPSGHLVQAVFIAGLLPTAVGVLTKSPGTLVTALRVVLGGFVVVTAVVRTQQQAHWPLDAVGGILLGLVVVLGTLWVLEHRGWHQRCEGCPWSRHPDVAPWGRGLFDLPPRVAAVLRWAGPFGAVVAASALIAAASTIGIPTSPEDEGLGAAIAEPLQLGLAALMVTAGLVALRWRATGAFLMAMCAGGLGLLASVQYAPVAAFALTLVLLVPAVITWLAWQPNETVGSISALALITITSLTATTVGSREVYGYYFGPTHPESLAAELDSEAEWLWLGGVTPTTAVVVAGGLGAGQAIELDYWTSSDDHHSTTAMPDADGIARFELEGLSPATAYSYAIDDDGGADSSFRTFASGPQDLTIVAGSCARLGANGAVFDEMLRRRPDLYLALGDIHYGNVASSESDDHLRPLERTLAEPGQSALFRSVPSAYVWDDHDYGPNDADSSSPSRLAVGEAYRQAVPNYGIDADPEEPIAQAFTAGRVRFVMTDTRSQRTADTMLGADQLAWLIEELTSASRTHALVVWANPTPWISDAGVGADDWSAYPQERRFIADAIAEAGITNLIMVSGDAHMVAIDDGTNSGYASNGYPGFAVLHAAALDRPGSTKGGPYSHGTFPGGGQFGLIEIHDDGGAMVTVALSGHNWRGEELVHYELEIDVPATLMSTKESS